MESIQKHEWGQSHIYSWLFQCMHCKTDKIIDLNVPGRALYGVDIDDAAICTEEPACITRYPELEGKNDDHSDTGDTLT